MTNENDSIESSVEGLQAPVDAPIEAPVEAPDKAPAQGEVAPWLAQHRWKPGQSGNPSGRPRESGSLSAALRRVGIKPARTRAELVKIAQQLGMDPDETQNIDVIAGLMYDGITQLLIRTVKGSTTAGDKLVGLLQLLHKALDGDERRITFNGPGDVQAALASVSAVLGFRVSAPIQSLTEEAAAEAQTPAQVGLP
jgi:hypothetical protein